jgi:hypothetical protein
MISRRTALLLAVGAFLSPLPATAVGKRRAQRKVKRLRKKERCAPFYGQPVDMRPAECRERKHKAQKLERKRIRAGSKEQPGT